MSRFEIKRTVTVTIEMGEEYSRKMLEAVSKTLAQFDTSDPIYNDLVNDGHIDTLVHLKNALSQELR